LWNTRKRKPDQEVAAVECNPRGKKSGNNDIRESHAQTMPDTSEVVTHALRVRHHPQVTQCTTPPSSRKAKGPGG
jgi:hypothetical protein